MKLVVKFGGTSLATVKDIKNVVKTVDKIAKKNKTVVVCSAVDGTTDELIQISSLIEKGNKENCDYEECFEHEILVRNKWNPEKFF